MLIFNKILELKIEPILKKGMGFLFRLTYTYKIHIIL